MSETTAPLLATRDALARWTCPYCDDPLIDHPKPECTERCGRAIEVSQ